MPVAAISSERNIFDLASRVARVVPRLFARGVGGAVVDGGVVRVVAGSVHAARVAVGRRVAERRVGTGAGVGDGARVGGGRGVAGASIVGAAFERDVRRGEDACADGADVGG